MTKEDKQIIDRAIKENWRTGDRTRLKHLLKKNLELYRENVKLEKENSLLGERCNQLLKDKGDLIDKIADIKANCDFALEGKDIEIKELKEKHESSISQWKYELNKLIHNEVELSKENRTLEGCLLAEQEHTQMLEQQIEKMKRHCNCKHRDGEGYCEVKRTYLIDLSYDGCDKWELED